VLLKLNVTMIVEMVMIKLTVITNGNNCIINEKLTCIISSKIVTPPNVC
jgi:hypothetical protein